MKKKLNIIIRIKYNFELTFYLHFCFSEFSFVNS